MLIFSSWVEQAKRRPLEQAGKSGVLEPSGDVPVKPATPYAQEFLLFWYSPASSHLFIFSSSPPSSFFLFKILRTVVLCMTLVCGCR